MPRGVSVTSSYRSRRHEVRDVLNVALANRRSYFGFVVGLITTLVIVGFVFAYLVSRPDLLPF